MPVVGGDYFLFFSPVFNVADSAIFVGVVIILFCQRIFFRERADGRSASPVASGDSLNPTQGNDSGPSGMAGALSDEGGNKESF